ncbi:MAG TPA: hypothetical protein PLF21_05290 [Exilispira sp.]|nr:hypothetical protein [Exilispira sp.]
MIKIIENKKIKNIILILFLFIFLTFFFNLGTIFAQTKALSISIGFTTPFGPASGFTLSTLFGVDFDEAVFYGFGLDFANGSWLKDSKENSFVYFPLYGALRIRFPFTLPFALYSIMGVGYSLLLDKIQLSTDGSSTIGAYGSFFWKVAIGFGFMLGTKTDGIFEVHISSFSYEYWGKSTDFPSQLNFVTIGFYFGIRFFRM